MSTLLKAHSCNPLVQPEAISIRTYLQAQFERQDGLLGFDSGLLTDADDTAKTILSLNLLGFPASPKQMLEEFETADHFRTYKYEKHASFSAKCNVLDALLHCNNPEDYLEQIIKASWFLCRQFNLGNIRDKWNLSEGYSKMLLSQAFIKLLQRWDSGQLKELPLELISEQIPIVLFQIGMETLQMQQLDGSWSFNGTFREITAYAVLTLKTLSSVPWLAHFHTQIEKAIRRGSAYLVLNYDQWGNDECIWVAKVTYALPFLARAYNIAALSAGPPCSWGPKVKALVAISVDRVKEMAGFFSSLPMFRKDEAWMLEGDLVLGSMYHPRLLRMGSSVFAQDEKADNRYLEYIPFTWIAMNRKNHRPLSNTTLWETMMVSLLVYQLDEYMEIVFREHRDPRIMEQVRQIVRLLCGFDTKGDGNVKRTSDHQLNYFDCSSIPRMEEIDGSSSDGASPSLALEQATATLRGFTSYILQHSAVVKSPDHIRRELHGELARCMLAHIDHEENSLHFAAQRAKQPLSNDGEPKIVPYKPIEGTYYSWVQTISANDTQSPVIFLLFLCLAAGDGQPFFVGARQHYLASALSRHLASLCRLYNDYGSTARDLEEGNLNSLNFPEFHETGHARKNPSNENGVHYGIDDEKAMKADLFFIAEYEPSSRSHITFLPNEGGIAGSQSLWTRHYRRPAIRVINDDYELRSQEGIMRKSVHN
ncbi:Uu.00g077800.m01.CDS01 [Anthostomella pinea]|uniref:Uu.00g077800.m01.CDS01 n=1 Tax=Anthostomella pinea TaxID=933095 RepID=A0AAI8VKF4_9PEZI|nr:Uu.00g077800.m01.CDS01 [Anthostomella pinea]